MNAEDLRDVPLFADLDDEELAALAPAFHEVRVWKNAWLARQGEWGYRFFVILEGTATVVIDGAVVAELGPGDFFGEIAVSAHDRRSADVEATRRMRLASMMTWKFNDMMARHPSIAAQVEAARSQRLAARTA